jgi:serine/threonine-protein kinase
MSPEQALGEREVDGRSDIYSLGVIGYQMLAGETPFKASNTPAMLVKHVSETPRPLALLRPDVPAGLAYAIAKAMAKKPEDRWPDAETFRKALLDTSNAAPPPEPHIPPPNYRMPPAPPLSAQRPVYDVVPQPPAYPRGYPPAIPPMPPLRPAPEWGSKADWRDWRRERKDWMKEQRRRNRVAGLIDEHDDAGLNVEERLARFRRNAIGNVVTIASLGAVNMLTSPHFLWFLFPSAFMAIGIFGRAGKLWADGVPLTKVFSRGDPKRMQQAALASVPTWESIDVALNRMVSQEVLQGPYGELARRAASDFVSIRDTLARLPESERAMIPDVAPTVDALAERVGALATTLHRLDQDIGSSSGKMVEAKLAALRAESRGSPTPEQERRIALLERQRVSISELGERRTALVAQLESAALALQNLRLDLLKLRSSGLESAMSDVASATQEARALSRDIANAVEAAREMRDL